jgi:hypothetical protein
MKAKKKKQGRHLKKEIFVVILVSNGDVLFKVPTLNVLDQSICRAPLHEECPQHHGHKGDPGVTPGTCDAIGERDQVTLMWVRAPGI